MKHIMTNVVILTPYEMEAAQYLGDMLDAGHTLAEAGPRTMQQYPGTDEAAQYVGVGN